MRVVDRPYSRPHRCAALPYVGQTKRGIRWIDTGCELPGFDNHVYLSETAVVEAARLLGWPAPGEFRRAVGERDAALAELEAVRAERDELQARFDAIDVLASADFVARKKAGRPAAKKPTEGVVA